MSYPGKLRGGDPTGSLHFVGAGPGKLELRKFLPEKGKRARGPHDLAELEENGSRRLPATKVWKEAQ